MTCGLCRRTISAKDVKAKRYTFSRFTEVNYCIRPDCRTIYARIKKAEES